jgi:E3 ubiquitin-protein ligase RGLG
VCGVPSPAARGIHLTDGPTERPTRPPRAMGQRQSHSKRDGSSHGRRSRSFQQQPSAQWGAGGGGYYQQDPSTGYYGAPVPQQGGGYYQQDPGTGYYGATVPQQGGGYAAPYRDKPAAAAVAAPAPQAAKPRQLDRRYSRIADEYHSVDQVRGRLLCHWVNRSVQWEQWIGSI